MEEHKMDKLKFLVGETIFYCQALEHDLKIIYSCYTATNLKQVQQKSNELSDQNLGAIILKLKTDGHLDKDGVRVLNQIRKIRNYLAHEVFTDVVYLPPQQRDTGYQAVYDRVQDYNSRISKVMREVEAERIHAVKEVAQRH
jgi:uncharacterized protein YutE (UPF0331/DUF86 family)